MEETAFSTSRERRRPLLAAPYNRPMDNVLVGTAVLDGRDPDYGR
jgi:hypothetical protein